MLDVRAIIDVPWELEGELNGITTYGGFQPDEMNVVRGSACTLRKNRRGVKAETLLTIRLPDSNSHLAHENGVNLRPIRRLSLRIRRTVKVAALATAMRARAAAPVVSFILVTGSRERNESEGLSWKSWKGETSLRLGLASEHRSADGRRRQSPQPLRFSRLLTSLKIYRQMSESEQEMPLKTPLKLASIKTLRELYKAGVIKTVKSPKYPHKPAFLDRVSLWSVTSISRRVRNRV